jgi:hypothetical protein
MRRLTVLMMVAGVLLGGLWLWHGRAVAHSLCIYECVPNELCYGTTELECWGCVTGSVNYSCQSQMGRKDWWNEPTYGSSNTGTQYVQYNESVPCYWITRCGSAWYPGYSCGAGLCRSTPYEPLGCAECRLAEGSYSYISYYVNAVCSDCPSGN